MAFGGLTQTGAPKDVAEINMIPLIDVMLVLLVNFIITAPLLTHAVKVDLPQAISTPSPAKPETVHLSIKANGEVYWNAEKMNPDEWRTKMQDASAKTPQPEIHIHADGELAYRHVAQVMADAARVGLSKLGFVTDPRDVSARGAE